MWTPSYYSEWHRRFAEVSALDTHQKRVIYASRNGLDHVIEVCLLGREAKAAFSTSTARRKS